MPMDELPLLDYGLVDVEKYVLAEVPGERSLQITTSRGCPMRCGYCYLTVVPDGRRYRAESPERTVERIARLLRLYGLNAIHIIDDEFFTVKVFDGSGWPAYPGCLEDSNGCTGSAPVYKGSAEKPTTVIICGAITANPEQIGRKNFVEAAAESISEAIINPNLRGVK